MLTSLAPLPMRITISPLFLVINSVSWTLPLQEPSIYTEFIKNQHLAQLTALLKNFLSQLDGR